MIETRKLNGVQYIRISGAAGLTNRPTLTSLDDFTDAELTKAFSVLCDYATQLEQSIDYIKSKVSGMPNHPWLPGSTFIEDDHLCAILRISKVR